jgi:uncharacterized MAPEG superfamily protein
MTTDLSMLVWTALLCLAFPVTYLVGRVTQPGGTVWAFGNRATPLETPPWVGRAVRAHLNLVENLAPFAILVLVAQVSGRANVTTALGAALFFWGRVLHAAIYIAGLAYVRTIAFFVAVAGEVLILSQLIR